MAGFITPGDNSAFNGVRPIMIFNFDTFLLVNHEMIICWQ